VIQARYDLFQSGALLGCATHITTNLTWNDLSKYGDRVTDRMVEMFNLIHFDPNTPSRRQ
jgi:DNA replication protein DnaC